MVIGIALVWTAAVSAAPADCSEWPAWKRFESTFISRDGRVIDSSTPQQHTVSEAQAYAMFFALVADDRHGFERLLQWTEDNLAAGDLTRRLPAWNWGRGDAGRWDVLDKNPAADADLWMAYVLAEAGEQWNERRYRVLSQLMGRNIQSEEVKDLRGLGPVLLPAPQGFQIAPSRWRLNPSYSPVQVLRGLHTLQPQLEWQRLLPGTQRLLHQAAPMGFAADWVVYDEDSGFLPDEKTKAVGSYDAIRVYLWAGLLDAAEPLRASLLTTYRPMAERTRTLGAPPERVNTVNGKGDHDQTGGAGFSAALLPFLQALDFSDVVQAQRSRLQRSPPESSAYYAQVLSLFSAGAMDGYYRFDANGRLHRSPMKPCAGSPSPSSR